MMDVMRHVGRGAEAIASHRAARPAATKRAKLDAITGAKKRKVLGVERTRPAAPPDAPRPPPPAARARTAAPPPVTTAIGGVELTADGHLADPMTWTPQLGAELAAALGVELGEPQVKVVQFAREDFLATGMAPNIRRITLGLGVTTRDVYALFPKAPARTIAKIAGIPKPVGCL
jgi:TusE/DsrC/DsvC family sulfur relay protein